jgi:hypothetical protein
VLNPGSRKTKTGYLWAHARDHRPWGGDTPPGVAFTYAPGRGGIHAERILQGFSGILQVDGYAGYDRLVTPDRIASDIRLAYCWAHARRKLVEVTRNGSAPITEGSVKRIGELYRMEAELRGLDPEARLAGRQERSAQLVADMQTWFVRHRASVASKSPLGEALACIAKFWDGLKLFLTDGRIEIDNNSVERTIRPIALNRKNALFAGHDAGAENWATIASLIETCKLNAVDPQAYLTATLTAIVKGHKQSRIGELYRGIFGLKWDSPAATMRLDQPPTKTKDDFFLQRRIGWQARDTRAIARSKPKGLFHPVDFNPWRFVFLQDYDARAIVSP